MCTGTEIRKTKRKWSEYKDSNLGPPAPKAGALPGCATLRRNRYSTPRGPLQANTVRFVPWLPIFQANLRSRFMPHLQRHYWSFAYWAATGWAFHTAFHMPTCRVKPRQAQLPLMPNHHCITALMFVICLMPFPWLDLLRKTLKLQLLSATSTINLTDSITH